MNCKEDIPIFRQGAELLTGDLALNVRKDIPFSNRSYHVENSDHTEKTTSLDETSESVASSDDEVGPKRKKLKDKNKALPSPEAKGSDVNDVLFDLLQSLHFDRTEEKLLLRQTFLNRLHGIEPPCPRTAFAMIEGPSGSGKISMVKEALQETVEAAGGYFLTGKFDILQLPVPYPGLVQAFTEFTYEVMKRGSAEIIAVRNAVREALGEECHVLTSMIPALNLVLNFQTESARNNFCSSSSPEMKLHEISNPRTNYDSTQRFVFVFRRFILSICTTERPIVICLDDLRYADQCSLDLLARLVVAGCPATDKSGLFVVGTACSDIKTSARDNLQIKLHEMEHKARRSMITIRLENFNEDQICNMLAKAFYKSSSEMSDFASIVHEKTKGNLFRIRAFLGWMAREELLEFDSRLSTWKWDMDEIEISLYGCSEETSSCFNEFAVQQQIDKLPPRTKDVLKVAACMGYHINENAIGKVLGIPIGNSIQQAVQCNILVFNEAKRMYAFLHNEVQLSAYNLIVEQERKLFHLEIGRRLWRKLDHQALDNYVYLVLAQMRIGRELISRQNERIAVANLCLHAGTKAARASNFHIAAIFLDFGIEMIEDRDWCEHYDLCLALYNFAAEVNVCTSNFQATADFVDEVLANARSLQHKIPAYCTRIYALSSQEQGSDAINLAAELLSKFGVKFPSRLCTFKLLKDCKRIKKLLRGKCDEEILNMAVIAEDDKIACLRILHLLFLSSMVRRIELAPYIILLMMRITLEDGLSAFASIAFANYGMLCISAGDDVKIAHRYGKIALKLLERFKANEFVPRVYAAVHGIINTRIKPLRESLPYLLEAHTIGLHTGDTDGAFLCANLYCMNAMESNVPLGEINAQAKGFRDLMLGLQQKTMYALSLPFAQAIHHLIGITDDPLEPKGDLFDYETALQSAGSTELKLYKISLPSWRLQLAYTFKDYDLAEALMKKCFKHIALVPPQFQQINCIFFCGMVALVCARKGQGYRSNLKIAKKCIRSYKSFAELSPQNCLDKLYLLEGELASLQGKNDRAFRKYTAAIAMTESQSLLRIRGHAYESAARHLYALGNKSEALTYFDCAVQAYTDWGAMRKVERLKNEVQYLRERGSSDKFYPY